MLVQAADRDDQTSEVPGAIGAKDHEIQRPAPADPGMVPRTFTRGKKTPRAISWFGVLSFWGHLQHLIASAIASENIDSRDWMHADPPEKLAEQLVRLIGGEDAEAKTVTDGLGRDLWIDYVADTGDDSSVSERVGRIISVPYELPDPDAPDQHLVAPRGDILLFGGDTAYPVATANEIHDRMVVPFNRAFVAQHDGKRRALLGIPGNHDWYDGLDGFARTFRRRIGELSIEQMPIAEPIEQAQPSVTKDRESRFEHVVDFMEQFVAGGVVTKRKALVLDGYVPMQHASYFVLPLAPGLDLFAVDRQLRSVDFRQRKFFAARRAEKRHNSLFVVIPDPVYAYLEPAEPGFATMKALELDPEKRNHFVLCGDIHHYERRKVGESLHVIAGGGGAFLHAARVQRKGLQPPQAEWPDAPMSKRLLRQVPWQVAAGRAGFIPHIMLFCFLAPAMGIGIELRSRGGILVSSLIAGLCVAVVCSLIGGFMRRRSWKTLLLATIFGVTIGSMPVLLSRVLHMMFGAMPMMAGPIGYPLLLLVLGIFVGTFFYGGYLAALTWLGLENTQAFTALGHPGFKHFLRLRVRRDGSAIDVWCIGLVSPLRLNEPAVLVDRFTWRPTKK
jgi:hypothetical protein